MSCPAVDQLLAFSTGELPDDRAVEVEAHIDECSECRAVLSNVARGGPPPSLGRYRIDTVLGSGGMGIVYRGYDPQLARPVAIKVVRRAGEDSTGRARLVREAQALARLSHPHVCHVYDVGTHDDEVWVAMELIDGVHLRQWADEGRTREEVIATLLGAAEGIAAAHAAGLVHRDIKPENVLVTRDGRAIVTDFGLARHEDAIDVNAPTMASDPQLTATGAIAGTPAYLAPEQLLGDPIDQRVDQFAWAVMAWELLVGSRPFPIVFAVRVEAIREGIKIPKELPPHIGSVLARAMQAAPKDRFGSMRELIDAFRATPVARDKATPLVPVRGRAAAIAGLVVLGAAGAAVFAWPRDEEPPRAAPSLALPAAAAVVPADAAVAITPPADAAEAIAVAVEPPKPAVAVAVPKPKQLRKSVIAPIDDAPTPAPKQEQQITQAEPTPPIQAPVPQPRRPGYCRSCQIAVADSFCRIPPDFALRPAGAKSDYGIVDWGAVTKVDVEIGTFGEQPLRETVITLRGQRRTYRFTSEFLNTRIDTTVGSLLAICPEGDSDLYKLSGGPTDKTRAVITLTAAPKTRAAAKLGAIHIDDLKLAAVSLRKTLERGLDPNARYLVHAKVEGINGERYKMDRYWLEVPKGMKNEDLLETGKHTWMVVEKPEIEENAEGEKYLVVRAAAILEDIFP